MLRGRVNEQGEPLITVKLILNSVPTPLSAVIDTGFNGYLSVPKSIIARSKWEWLGYENYELASGAVIREQVYLGQIIFDGRQLEVYAVATDSDDILVGTRLLQGKQLWIDFASGEVRISRSRGVI